MWSLVLPLLFPLVRKLEILFSEFIHLCNFGLIYPENCRLTIGNTMEIISLKFTSPDLLSERLVSNLIKVQKLNVVENITYRSKFCWLLILISESDISSSPFKKEILNIRALISSGPNWNPSIRSVRLIQTSWATPSPLMSGLCACSLCFQLCAPVCDSLKQLTKSY